MSLIFDTFEIDAKGIVRFTDYGPSPKDPRQTLYWLEDGGGYVAYPAKLKDINATVWKKIGPITPGGLTTEQNKTILEIRSNPSMDHISPRYFDIPKAGGLGPKIRERLVNQRGLF